jgi:hypothetical protein
MPVKVFGLPTHILIIHLAVIGIPTACLATIAIAVRPAWRRRFGLWVAALDIVMVGVTYLTMLAGQALFNHATYLDQLAAVQEHKRLGQTLVYFVAAVAVFAILLAMQGRSRGATVADDAKSGGTLTENHVVTVTISALAIAASAICLVQVVRVGDSGARAVWGGINTTSSVMLHTDIR